MGNPLEASSSGPRPESGRPVEARAWCRVDLAGGTLDLWPLGLFHPGARTVNLAIDIAARVRLVARPPGAAYRVTTDRGSVEASSPEALAAEPEGALFGTAAVALELPPFDALLASDSPRGAGLGASSALLVAFFAAARAVFDRGPETAAGRSALGRDLEARLMGLPTGIQDHWPAQLGGLLEIRYEPGGERVRRLDRPVGDRSADERSGVDLEALGECLVVAYSGQSHVSAERNWQVVRRRLDGEAESVELFAELARVAAELVDALEAGDLERSGRLVGEEWSVRRRLAEGVSTPVVERLLEAGLGAGAWGGKVCGAGGGGCVALLAPPERRRAVADALVEAGARVLPARPAAEPLRIEWLLRDGSTG